jgi:hypothetical protein
MDDRKLLALARKNAAKAQQAQNKPRPTYDATLEATHPPEADDGSEAERIFTEMKRREF